MLLLYLCPFYKPRLCNMFLVINVQSEQAPIMHCRTLSHWISLLGTLAAATLTLRIFVFVCVWMCVYMYVSEYELMCIYSMCASAHLFLPNSQ